jgi:hypothetical protein
MRVGRMLQEWGISRPRRRTPVGPPLVGSMLAQWSRIRLRRCLQLVASSVPTSRSDIREDRDRPMAVTKTLACCLSHRSGEPLRSSLFSSAARDGHGVCELGAGHPSHQDNFGDPTFPVPAITAPVPNAPHPAVALAVRSARSCSNASQPRARPADGRTEDYDMLADGKVVRHIHEWWANLREPANIRKRQVGG